MNAQQARDLIQETFTQSFDKNRFAHFIHELLNRFDPPDSPQMLVPDAFKKHVRSCQRLGTYKAVEGELLDILIVNLTEDYKLERTRTALRDFVSHKLKRGDNYKDAALVAFVSPTEKQWRFSYVKMEYATVEKDSGKVGVETRLTPARRFSYLVGEGESCHTAQTQFLELLQDTQTDPALSDIEEAFSVEAVTKEFFTKYADLFEEIHIALDRLVAKDKAIRDEFEKKKVNTVNFAKKLMGQIVFLYFLQKKGWLGVAKGQDWGVGPRDFLRRLASGEHGKYDNFFNDILEPLFYRTLAEDRSKDKDWCEYFKCRIPFLNGGLFEPLGDYDWKKTDIILPNELFTNTDPVEGEEGITGTGVLDVFDRYNFTVNESEPLEKEVAIDPEMLGKVFENLIEDNRRKGLGAYYTPREIVHYMCQESLINYLDTALNTAEESIAPSKPKQAKLFGEQEPEQKTIKTTVRREIISREDIGTFIHLGEQISHYESVDTEYKIKMPKNIEKNARLIDDKLNEITICDPAVGSGAFLVGMMTEIVRARSALTSYFNDVHERTPYHFKRHAIQKCLYGVDIDAGAVEIAKLRLWLSLVVDEEDVKQIKPLPNLDYKIVPGNSLIGFLFKSQSMHEIEILKQRVFTETDHEKKANLKAQIDRKLQASFANSKKSFGYEVTFDFHVYFSEVFNEKGGFDIVIANPPYGETIKTAKEYFERSFECTEGKFEIYKYFIERGLTLLTPQGILSFITPDTWLTLGYFKKLRKFILTKYRLLKFTESLYDVFEDAVVDTMLSFIQKDIPRNSTVKLISSTLKSSKDISVSESPDFVINIKEGNKIIAKLTKGVPLGKVTEIWQGLIAYYSKDQLRTFSSAKKETPFHRKLLYGRDVGRYSITWGGEWLKYGDWLHRPRPSYIYDREKLLVQRIRNPQLPRRIVATYDAEKFLNGTGSSNILLKDGHRPIVSLKFILGVINSRAINYWFSYHFHDVNIKPEQLRKICIPEVDSARQASIISLVGKILAAKQCDAETDTTVLEREIDRLVYELYGLTADEIAIVEQSGGK